MCESMSLGVPTLAIPQVPHEFENISFFSKHNAVYRFSKDLNFSENSFFQSVIELIENAPLRKMLSENGKKIIDGKGLERITDIIQSRLLKKIK